MLPRWMTGSMRPATTLSALSQLQKQATRMLGFASLSSGFPSAYPLLPPRKRLAAAARLEEESECRRSRSFPCISILWRPTHCKGLERKSRQKERRIAQLVHHLRLTGVVSAAPNSERLCSAAQQAVALQRQACQAESLIQSFLPTLSSSESHMAGQSVVGCGLPRALLSALFLALLPPSTNHSSTASVLRGDRHPVRREPTLATSYLHPCYCCAAANTAVHRFFPSHCTVLRLVEAAFIPNHWPADEAPPPTAHIALRPAPAIHGQVASAASFHSTGKSAVDSI